MKDVSNWQVTSFGENSTLEKLELLSPDHHHYIIKFPREFDGNRTNWEDVNEIIAAKVAEMLGIKSIDAEIAYYNKRRGCLMKHFRFQWNADDEETAASLFSAEFGSDYDELQYSELRNQVLMQAFFSLFKSFSLFKLLRKDFVFMNLFDILIGNQDRHAHNWKILYIDQDPTFGPLYDNGASLGWQLPEGQIKQQLQSAQKMNKFYKDAQVKMGMDNKETPRIKAKQVLNYLIINYSDETHLFYNKLVDFNLDTLEEYLRPFSLLTDTRKQFIVEMVRFRRMKMLDVIKEGGTKHEHH